MVDPFLMVLTGPPGAGKTSVGPLVALRYPRSVCLSADWLWTAIVNGHVDPWLKDAGEQNEEVLRGVFASARRFVEVGYVTILEGIVGPWYLPVARDELAGMVAPISYVVLRPSLRVCLARVLERQGDPRHARALRDEEVITDLYWQFSDLGSWEKYVLDSSTQTADEVAAELVSQREDFALSWS